MDEILKFAECIMLIKQIDANIFVDNIKSINLIEKFGFILTGSKNYFFRGMEYPHKVYTKFITENHNKGLDHS